MGLQLEIGHKVLDGIRIRRVIIEICVLVA